MKIFVSFELFSLEKTFKKASIDSLKLRVNFRKKITLQKISREKTSAIYEYGSLAFETTRKL
jgi:hypothetical protein